MITILDGLGTARGQGGEQKEEEAGGLAVGQTGSPPCSSFPGAGWEFPVNAYIQPHCTAPPASLLRWAGAYLH